MQSFHRLDRSSEQDGHALRADGTAESILLLLLLTFAHVRDSRQRGGLQLHLRVRWHLAEDLVGDEGDEATSIQFRFDH